MLNKIMPFLLATVLILAFIPGCSNSDGSLKYGNRVGNLAYDFTLKDMGGNTVTLSSLAGQPVMVNFWDSA